jgi:uncharacterized membrane protein
MDSHIILALAHILVIAPALLYVAIRRAAIPGWTYSALLFIGLFIIVYHGYKGFVRLAKKSSYAWVNLIHALLIGPLITYIGFNGRETPRAAYELLAMTGFAAIGYHLYSLIKLLQIQEQA